jgi:hypothetical protein
MNRPDREAMRKVSKRLQEQSQKDGNSISYEQARQIVSASLQRSENKRKHTKNQG